jgi:D-psicose/D-tagatose/L-ribulose 3-epimerase
MELGLINSAFAQAGKGTAFGLRQARRIGFDTVDIFTDPLEIDIRERRRTKETADRLGLPIRSICCVALGLIDPNPSVQRFHLDRCRSYLDLCYEYNANNLLLVLGEYVWDRQIIPPPEQWGWAVQHVRELGEYAKRFGLQIAIELEPFHGSLINNVDTMLRFLKDVDLPGVVEANCDISHLHLMKIRPREVRRLKGRIIHVHLSDCDGKKHGDLPPGRGVTPIADYLKAIRDTGFDGTVSLELEFAPRPDRIVEWVTEAYTKTDEIMQKLNCRG